MSQREPDLLQLPSWDEFDQAEELDYEEEPAAPQADIQGREEVAEAEAEVSASSPSFVEEPSCSSSGDQQNASGNDQLPGVDDLNTRRRHVGPVLPAAFSLEMVDDAAPEDPSDDPEDPGNGSRRVPGTSSSTSYGPSLPQLFPQPGPSTSRDYAPALPSIPSTSGSGRQSTRHEPLPSVPGPSRIRDAPIGPSLPSSSRAMPIGPSLPGSSRTGPSIGPSVPSTSGIGPSLPPNRQRVPTAPSPFGPSIPGPSSSSSSSSLSQQRVVIGPSLHDTSAPTLPDDEFRAHSVNGIGSGSNSLPPPEPEEARPVVGPALPPRVVGRVISQPERVIGPAFPPDFMLPGDDNDNEVEPGEPSGPGDDDAEPEPEHEDLYGPLPPPDLPLDNNRGPSIPEMPVEEDDDVVGPMLPGRAEREHADLQYAMRLAEFEKAKAAEKNTTKREEWMTQLPKKLTNYGLGARTFNTGTVSTGADSTWTETPEQSRRRIELGEDAPGPSTSGASSSNSEFQRKRDAEQQALAEALNASRNESMIDSHQRKRKADNGTANEGESTGRRGFDRERDMEVRGLKGASAAEIKERCGALNNRFGHSNNQKFL